MATEAIALLKSIDASLKQLLAMSKTNTPKAIASDADLDGAYGDPVIKAADPRDWTGPTQKGKRFSECSSEYLELVASRLDFFAEREERENKLSSTGKPVAPYTRRDAARARGWAKRHRDGWRPPAFEASPDPAPEVSTSDDWADQGGFTDEIPF